ncbi:MAG TPA: hypothetical protein VM686_13985, partial [Polyangiaceae bacterium]|nr:hypothetical protein [Polyangiaceae bacterium]
MTLDAKALLATVALAIACSSSGEQPPSAAAGGAGAGGSSKGGASGATAAGAGGVAGAPEADGGESGQSFGGTPAGGSAGDNAAGQNGAEAGAGGAPVVKENCGADNPAGCYRGMYVSPYTDHIGQLTFAGDDLSYAFILGDDAKEQKLLDFAAAHGIDSLSLYNLHTILADEGLTDALESFMARARQAGILRIEGIGADSAAQWDELHAFHE